MKEFIEKLIERLEKEKIIVLKTYMAFNMNTDLGRMFGIEKSIEIINELAEEYKPKTQADKIRSMSDEELAGLTITYNDYCGEYYCSDEERYDSYEDAIKHEIEWLQSEAE